MGQFTHWFHLQATAPLSQLTLADASDAAAAAAAKALRRRRPGLNGLLKKCHWFAILTASSVAQCPPKLNRQVRFLHIEIFIERSQHIVITFQDSPFYCTQFKLKQLLS